MPNKPLTAYQDRVRMEKRDLDIKIERLTEFLDKLPIPISNWELWLMKKQLLAMVEYSALLGLRLKGFESESN